MRFPRLPVRLALVAAWAALALGCPRPLPDTPAPADLAALDARLDGDRLVAFRVTFYADGGPTGGAAVRLGPGALVTVTPSDGPAVTLRGAEARTRVVHTVLRRGAAELVETLARTGALPPPVPREVPGLRTAGWESVDGGDARGLLFPGDGRQTILWLHDASGLPARRDTEFLRATDAPLPPVEVYTDWAFGQ